MTCLYSHDLTRNILKTAFRTVNFSGMNVLEGLGELAVSLLQIKGIDTLPIRFTGIDGDENNDHAGFSSIDECYVHLEVRHNGGWIKHVLGLFLAENDSLDMDRLEEFGRGCMETYGDSIHVISVGIADNGDNAGFVLLSVDR